MMEPLTDYTLTVTHPNAGNISITFHEDCDLQEIKEVFTTVMTWLSFMPETIAQMFGDEDGE